MRARECKIQKKVRNIDLTPYERKLMTETIAETLRYRTENLSLIILNNIMIIIERGDHPELIEEIYEIFKIKIPAELILNENNYDKYIRDKFLNLKYDDFKLDLPRAL